MATKPKPKPEPRPTPNVSNDDPAQSLDALNARMRAKGRRASDSIRRSIEAEIEDEAKKRRRGEAPASSRLKR